jgi:hypothetical protein
LKDKGHQSTHELAFSKEIAGDVDKLKGNIRIISTRIEPEDASNSIKLG